MRLAIIDDYQSAWNRYVDWAQAPGVTVVPFRDHVFDEGELIARLSEFDAILRIRERTEFPRHVLEALPRLKLMLCTGMRNGRSIDLKAAQERGTTVCATEVHHTSTVEVVWLLVLSLFRGFTDEVGSFRAGGWQRGLGAGLAGKTLGILGLGHMGQPVARVGQALGMEIIAWSPNLTPERTAPLNVQCVSKEELFRRADAITIHMPLSERSIGIVGAADIARMKPTAFLVNTSRPQLVDEGALLAALQARRIGGAGLDVFAVEPLPGDHPYRSMPNVLATPHIGFVTQENYEIFYRQSFENLMAYLAGKPIRIINPTNPYLPEAPLAAA
jgi:phosphoglycerate dehydrogenase-like enzyme